MLDKSGQIRDLSGVIDDLSGPSLSRASFAKLAKLDLDKLPVVAAGTRIGACVGRVGHFIAVGLNYADHAKETGAAIPAEPILFSKAPSCVVGPNDDVVIPKGSEKSDWEVELAVVIGEPASYVSEAKALDHVAGFAVCNDLSERAWQMERGGQWIKGKSAPTFGPLGPWLVTPDEIADVQKLPLWLELNGVKVQNGSTATMIFGVAHLVSYISQFWRLEPGDVITTGTPPGVGLGMKPPKYLKPGDRMRLSVEGLGVQEQNVLAYTG
jgi:2-keto-4-pentenoate hydratase/2-oxohepta-3-ene-1,7-dioic acid hydratase in catechol pathway